MNHEFPCGTRVLDFASTLRARTSEKPFDFLRGAGDLDDWFAQAGVRTSGAATSEADFVSAVELREAIYTLVWHRMNGEDLPAGALAVLDDRARAATVVPTLRDGVVTRDGTAAQCQADLAREAIEILGAGEDALLRICARPGCTTIYLDTSRGHRREWCSMASCGNRAKAAAYRARVREARQG